MGDINIHLDKPSDAHTVKFQHVLSEFGLSQQVQSPTHRHGHLLDVLITRSDVNVRSLRVDPPMMSDQATIVAELDLPLHQNFSATRCARRCWRSFNLEDFVEDVEQSPLVQSPPSDITELFALYDSTLRSILDKHAPYTTVRHRASVSALRSAMVQRRLSSREGKHTTSRKDIPLHSYTRITLRLAASFRAAFHVVLDRNNQ